MKENKTSNIFLHKQSIIGELGRTLAQKTRPKPYLQITLIKKLANITQPSNYRRTEKSTSKIYFLFQLVKTYALKKLNEFWSCNKYQQGLKGSSIGTFLCYRAKLCNCSSDETVMTRQKAHGW